MMELKKISGGSHRGVMSHGCAVTDSDFWRSWIFWTALELKSLLLIDDVF
jgi:hypothetical protein